MQTAMTAATGAYWEWRGQKIYYVKAGDNQSKPPLLLIHGFGASTDHWRKNILPLSREFEVWAIDLLGFGRSSKPDLEYGGDLWRDQLDDFIQTVIQRPAVLAGNSLGGYSALCVAAQRPEAVEALVLLNSAGPFTELKVESRPDPVRSTFAKFAQSLLLQPLPSWLLFQWVRQKWLIRRTLESVYLDQTAVTDELVEEIYRPSCDPGAPTVFANVFKSPQGEKIDALLEQMRCPLLLLWGEGDPWMNARSRANQFRQHYPQLQEHFLQAGHCPHDEVPDQVNALLREWVLNLDREICDR